MAVLNPYAGARKRPAQQDKKRAHPQGTMNVKQTARRANGGAIGAALAYGRRWGALFLLVFAANVFVATLAWLVTGMFLN
jgi:hypothetical protein